MNSHINLKKLALLGIMSGVMMAGPAYAQENDEKPSEQNGNSEEKCEKDSCNEANNEDSKDKSE